MVRAQQLCILFLLGSVLLCACGAQGGSATVAPRALGEALLEYDRDLPLDPEIKERGEEEGARLFSLRFSSARGERVPGLLAIPMGGQGPYPCVILMHGLGGTKEGMQPFRTELAKNGYASIAIDAMYHGERTVRRLPTAILQYPYEGRSAFVQTIVDLRRTIDYLETREDIDSSRIAFVGLSMGAILGAVTAGVDERIKTAALIVGGGNWDVLLGKSILTLAGSQSLSDKEARARRVKALEPLDPIHWVGRISPRPVLMINGESDNIVPVESNRALHAAAKEPKKVVWYPGGHLPPADLLRRELLAWLSEHLKRKP